jgi:type III secretion system YscI/HrpB-like protein
MATPVTPISSPFSSASLAGVAAAAATQPASPPPASVTAFNALMGTDQSSQVQHAGLKGELFGTSATPDAEVALDSAPALRIPNGFNYSTGALNTLDQIFPSLPGAVPSPHEMLAAQMRISFIQLAWQFTGKLVGTSVQGFNTLVNSQV